MPGEAVKSEVSLFSRFIKTLFFILLSFVLYSIFIILFFRFFNPPVTAFIYSDGENEFASLITESIVEYNWIPIEAISDNVKLAVIASEDQLFFDHFGFDVEQIEKAVDEIKRNKRFRGASTITQQLAKNLFLWSGKDYLRKALEVYYTLLIELLWSKERILEVYLNVIEIGPKVYGVGAASRLYFRKSPLNLSEYDASLIAAVLPNPKRYSVKNPTIFIINKGADIRTKMYQLGGTEYLKNNL